MSSLKLTKLFKKRPLPFVNASGKRMRSELCDEEEKASNPCTTRSIEKNPCNKPEKDELEDQLQPVVKHESMWGNIVCCVPECIDHQPFRHDLVYLEKMKKKDRYQRTWWECPRLCYTQVKCDCEKLDIPEPERRPRGVGNPESNWKVKLNPCYKDCPPSCITRKSGCGTYIAPRKCCQKRCTLYPSYSECCKKPREPKPPNECNCATLSLCEVNAWLAARGLLKKEEQ